MTLKIKKLRDGVVTPRYAHKDDAGLDIFAAEFADIAPGKRFTFSLGFAIQLEPGTAAIVAGRSGLASKRGITTIGNVIDAGYTGEVHVILINLGDETLFVKPGDKIAQLLIVPVYSVVIEEVEELCETSRGSNGLGSTGT